MNDQQTQPTRYFLILSIGHSGGLWFSRVLNAHPQTLCLHEGVLQRIYPRRYWELVDQDILDFFGSLIRPAASRYHKAYCAVGDVGSVSSELTHHEFVRKNFLVYGLVRHPASYIRSYCTTMQTESRPALVDQVNICVNYAFQNYPEIAGLVQDYEDKVFVQAAWTWRCFETANYHNSFRLEDLANNRNYLEAAFAEITGVKITDFKNWKMITGEAINSHVGSKSLAPEEIVRQWPDHWRKIFQTICSESMQRFGYEFPK